MASAGAWLAAALLAYLPAPAMAASECAMADGDRVWLSNALAQWRQAQREELQLGDRPSPTVYAVDEACTYVLPEGELTRAAATPHPAGAVELPEVGTVPLGPISFAFSGKDFVMSLPSVWRAAGVESPLGLEALMTGVLLHEIAHTAQAGMVAQADVLAKAKGLGDQLSDDLIQEKFARIPGYEAALREEIATLFAAAAAPDEAGARGLAAHALHMLRDRRARWLSGDNAHFAVFDDTFLTMEGTGQWLIYRHLQKPGGGVDPARALVETRRGGAWWSQDEGLALMMVLDRLLPDWRARIFRQPDWLAENLLAAAAGARP